LAGKIKRPASACIDCLHKPPLSQLQQEPSKAASKHEQYADLWREKASFKPEVERLKNC